MRDRIPEVAEAVVIEDFYRGSNDSAFVRAILQKAPTTSEQLFREADLYITTNERAQDLIGGAKPAPVAQRHDTNQQPDKRWEKRPREEVHAAGPPASHARGGPRGGERRLEDILDAQCPYHKDMHHTLRNCRDFKHSVGNGRPFQPLLPPPPRGGPGEPRQPQQQEEGGGGAFPRIDIEVNVIFGGHGSQESKRQQKLNDRQILVAATGPPAPYRWSEHPITFTFDHPGKYPLLVDPVIRESRVKKVLVDRGSSINVTFPQTLQGLGVPLKELHESDTPFFGIVPTEGEYPLGHIYMPVTFGTLENYRIEFLRFEVANFNCGYNTIIRRPRLAKFMAIPHYTYMILKMPEPQGIITVRADFQGAAECFRVAIQAALTTKPSAISSAQANSKPEEDLAVPANEAQAMTSIRPTEETKRINLGFADERKTAIISSSLDDKKEGALVQFLQDNRDLFAWQPADMPGVPRELAEHKLKVYPQARPIQQKLRRFTPDKREAIRAELARLVAAGFIREVLHPEWLANPILVLKKNKVDWRMCVDYTDLNKHCPKDPFGLPRIDQVVDSTAGCSVLSFLDCYFGYHQISLAKEDEEKTAFITLFGAFCYTSMPFGLKNAGVTYQRAIQTCLADHWGKRVEAYVDDVVIKTENSENFIEDL
jgi:hypothetical protein